MQRYHPALVALRWLMALVILLALVAGTLLANLPPESPDKVLGLAGHMTVGIAIGVLLLIRLAVRLGTSHPPDASTGNALLDRVGRWTHWAFYRYGVVRVGHGLWRGSVFHRLRRCSRNAAAKATRTPTPKRSWHHLKGAHCIDRFARGGSILPPNHPQGSTAGPYVVRQADQQSKVRSSS